MIVVGEPLVSRELARLALERLAELALDLDRARLALLEEGGVVGEDERDPAQPAKLRDRPDPAGVLWARRSWFAIDGYRLLVQEVFLPESHP